MTDDNATPQGGLTPDELADAQRLSGVGCTQEQIAQFLGMTAARFQSRLENTPDGRASLARSRIGASASVANSLYKRATEDGDTAAAKFWLERMGGPQWRGTEQQTNINVSLTGALRDLGRVIDGEAHETGHRPPIEPNMARGFIESDQSLSGDPAVESRLASSKRYIVRDALAVVDALAAEDDDPDP